MKFLCRVSRNRFSFTKTDCLLSCTITDSMVIWASSQESLPSGFPTKQVSNQSPQLHRLARKLKFYL